MRKLEKAKGETPCLSISQGVKTRIGKILYLFIYLANGNVFMNRRKECCGKSNTTRPVLFPMDDHIPHKQSSSF